MQLGEEGRDIFVIDEGFDWGAIHCSKQRIRSIIVVLNCRLDSSKYASAETGGDRARIQERLKIWQLQE